MNRRQPSPISWFFLNLHEFHDHFFTCIGHQSRSTQFSRTVLLFVFCIAELEMHFAISSLFDVSFTNQEFVLSFKNRFLVEATRKDSWRKTLNIRH